MSPTPYTLEGFNERFKQTLDQFKEYDISEQTLRTVYEIEILRKKLQEDVTKDVPQTETQVLARHFLVDSEEETKTVQLLLNQGEDFAEVARKYSKDTGSGQNGGDLGWAPVSNYVPEFAEAVKTQEIGVIGEPVKTQFGYHIIQVIAREELPLTGSQLDQKKQTVFDEWLTSAREAAKTTIYDIWKERVPTEQRLIRNRLAVDLHARLLDLKTSSRRFGTAGRVRFNYSARSRITSNDESLRPDRFCMAPRQTST